MQWQKPFWPTGPLWTPRRAPSKEQSTRRELPISHTRTAFDTAVPSARLDTPTERQRIFDPKPTRHTPMAAIPRVCELYVATQGDDTEMLRAERDRQIHKESNKREDALRLMQRPPLLCGSRKRTRTVQQPKNCIPCGGLPVVRTIWTRRGSPHGTR